MIIDPSEFFVVYLVLAVVWVMQFAFFMALDDRSFPGSHDKLIWAAAFLLAFPVAPFAFMVWKSARKAYVEAVRASDESIRPGSVQ